MRCLARCLRDWQCRGGPPTQSMHYNARASVEKLRRVSSEARTAAPVCGAGWGGDLSCRRRWAACPRATHGLIVRYSKACHNKSQLSTTIVISQSEVRNADGHVHKVSRLCDVDEVSVEERSTLDFTTSRCTRGNMGAHWVKQCRFALETAAIKPSSIVTSMDYRPLDERW